MMATACFILALSKPYQTRNPVGSGAAHSQSWAPSSIKAFHESQTNAVPTGRDESLHRLPADPAIELLAHTYLIGSDLIHEALLVNAFGVSPGWKSNPSCRRKITEIVIRVQIFTVHDTQTHQLLDSRKGQSVPSAGLDVNCLSLHHWNNVQ